ncbi:YopX family protein [Brevibacillus laterosporus]|uniref:YopX family protein n=1 Tax=Brevibacillus laterosporus TaxID=1465 RepID=UPI003D20F498
MREIKFRAWDKKCKEMFPVHELEFDKISQLLETVIGYDDHDSDGWTRHGGHGNRYANGVRFEIMQFTGLHDKNGKEIYEGDIIKRNFEIGRVVINPISLGAEDYEIDDSGYFIGVVSYRPSEGYVLNKCKKFNDDDELQSKKSGVKIYPNHAEVIGNIYENPDLLGV